MPYHKDRENSTEPIRSSACGRAGIRRNSNLGTTKAEPILGRNPEFWDRPALGDSEEEVEDSKNTYHAHNDLEATDMPA